MRRPSAGAGRRAGLRGIGGGRPPTIAWGPFASGYLETAAGNGIRGVAGDWGFGIVFGKTQDQAGGIDYVVQCGLLASNRGWYIAITSAGAVVVRVHDGVGTLQTAAPGTAVTNKWNALIVQGNNGEVKAALNGATSWATTGAITGYTAPAAGDTFVVGARSAGSTPFEFGRIKSCGGSDVAKPTDANRDAWFASVRAAIQSGVGWSDLPSGNPHAWVAPAETDVGSTGGHDLTNNTAPEPSILWGPAW